jgi:hypothetical protein
MKKLLLSFLLLMAGTLMSQAQDLKFHPNGEFKIVQFTDVHYILDDPRATPALRNIDAILDAEHPDLVVVTGDVIFGAPGKETFKKVADQINKHNIPFVMLFGNHDKEFGKCERAVLYDAARSDKNNIQPDRKGVDSPDYVLRIKASNSKNDAALVYCFDSHDYPAMKNMGTYDWMTNDQVQWYRKESATLTKENNGQPLPAVAFFHIPLPEFHEAALDPHGKLIGTRMENECPPDVNSGLYLAMKESGDVMGVFCGHDHDNDYATIWHDIMLAYGRYTGGNTVYNHLPRGARIIVLKEGTRTFDTYVREQKGNIVNRISYPKTFISDEAEKRPIETE